MAGLRKAVELATEVKGQKRKYVQMAEIFKGDGIADLISEKEGREPVKRLRTHRRCGHCREIGHNA